MQKIKSTVKPKKEIRAKTLSVSSSISLSQIQELDVTDAKDGSLLIYDGSVKKFKSTNQINNPNTTILGGGF